MFGDFHDGFIGVPFIFGFKDDSDHNTKLYHDSYRVFVNEDPVGYKTLVAQNEDINDVKRYLNNKGFENFTAKLVGNEYYIKSEDGETEDMKDTLKVYLNIR